MLLIIVKHSILSRGYVHDLHNDTIKTRNENKRIEEHGWYQKGTRLVEKIIDNDLAEIEKEKLYCGNMESWVEIIKGLGKR